MTPEFLQATLWLLGLVIGLLVGLLWFRRRPRLPRELRCALDQRLAQLQARRVELAALPPTAKLGLQNPETPEGAEILLWQTLRRMLEGAHRRGVTVAVVALESATEVEIPPTALQFHLALETVVLLEPAPELAHLAVVIRRWLPATGGHAGVAVFPQQEWHEDWLLARALAALDCARKQQTAVYGLS